MIYEKYGQYYDVIYHEKNYEAECNDLMKYFHRFGGERITTILDAGCGTGNHSIRLAEKGYRVVGIDVSETKISVARQKAEDRGLHVDFYVQDMRKLDLDTKFDAILCLFGGFGYCTTDKDIGSTLKRFQQHLREDDLLIMDFWPIHANIRREHVITVSEIEQGGYEIIRIINSTFDLENDTVRLDIKCHVIKNATVLDSFQEQHVLRMFSLPEMKHFLNEHGFELNGFFKIMWRSENPYSLEKVDHHSPNVACVAKKTIKSHNLSTTRHDDQKLGENT